MNRTSLVQRARTKKKEKIVAYLKESFKDFDCPVYSFGSYATETFHSNSYVDIPVIFPQAAGDKNYREAYDKRSDLGIGYDIMVRDSMRQLDQSIVKSLQKINVAS